MWDFYIDIYICVSDFHWDSLVGMFIIKFKPDTCLIGSKAHMLPVILIQEIHFRITILVHRCFFAPSWFSKRTQCHFVIIRVLDSCVLNLSAIYKCKITSQYWITNVGLMNVLFIDEWSVRTSFISHSKAILNCKTSLVSHVVIAMQRSIW